jgi:DNA-binding PadR family transcriptional regulator
VSRSMSNPLALAVLSCLRQRPMHPYEMAQTMRAQQHDSAVRLNFGSLYNVVAGLARDGFIVARAVDRNGARPERTVYEITGAGHDELANRLRVLLGQPSKEYTLFGAGLTFMTALPPGDVLAELESRLDRLRQEIDRDRLALTDARTGAAPGAPPVPGVFLVEDEYQLAAKETELSFVTALARDIRERTLDGFPQWAAAYPPETTEREPSGPS